MCSSANPSSQGGDDCCAGQAGAESFTCHADAPTNRLVPTEGDTPCRLTLKPYRNEPAAALRAGAQAAEDSAHDDTPIPFVVQHERRLFLVTWEMTCWTLAELEFDAASCTFIEQRRSSYEWPREAFGVLLSRIALLDSVDPTLLQRTSEDFARWLGSQFRVYASAR